jgi:hypothetical protein
MNLKLISDSGVEAVQVSQAKAQLRYTTLTDQDQYIGGLIVAARMMAEIWNGRQMTLKQWDLAIDQWPGIPMFDPCSIANPYFGSWPSDAYRLLNNIPANLNAIQLPAPLVSVQYAYYYDSCGVLHNLVQGTPASVAAGGVPDYIVDSWKEPGIIYPSPPSTGWPVTNLWPSSAIHVGFLSGFIPWWYVQTGISAVTLVSPGAGGYQVGDLLFLSPAERVYDANDNGVTNGGGYGGTLQLLTVDSVGNPLTWSIYDPGSLYAVNSISTPYITTGGYGAGATFNVTALTTASAPVVKTSIAQGMTLLVNQWFTDRVPYDAIRFVAEPPFAVAALFGSNRLWI